MDDIRLQVLYVSKRLPVRDANHAGGQITYKYLCSMAEWADVDVIALAAGGESAAGMPPVRSTDVILAAGLDRTDASSLKGILVRGLAYSRLLARATRAATGRRYDVVVLERSALCGIAPFLSAFCGVKQIVLIVHDLWFDRLEADARGTGVFRSMYFSWLSRLARAFETWGQRNVSGIICFDYRTREIISSGSGHVGQLRLPVLVLPPYYTIWPEEEIEPSSVCFYGNMARSVNWRSAIWFIERVLPMIRTEVSNAVFYVVGASPPDSLLKHHDGKTVVVTGYLDAPGALLARAQAFVAPLLSGTGIKIKVLEAMASGVPVVGNGISLQGIPAQRDRDYLHAESAEEFAVQVVRLLNDMSLGEALAENARGFVTSRFDYEGGASRQRYFFEQLAVGFRDRLPATV
jgi:glycosyltransferase involved in cell wall biosynthesis